MSDARNIKIEANVFKGLCIFSCDKSIESITKTKKRPKHITNKEHRKLKATWYDRTVVCNNYLFIASHFSGARSLCCFRAVSLFLADLLFVFCSFFFSFWRIHFREILPLNFPYVVGWKCDKSPYIIFYLEQHHMRSQIFHLFFIQI